MARVAGARAPNRTRALSRARAAQRARESPSNVAAPTTRPPAGDLRPAPRALRPEIRHSPYYALNPRHEAPLGAPHCAARRAASRRGTTGCVWPPPPAALTLLLPPPGLSALLKCLSCMARFLHPFSPPPTPPRAAHGARVAPARRSKLLPLSALARFKSCRARVQLASLAASARAGRRTARPRRRPASGAARGGAGAAAAPGGAAARPRGCPAGRGRPRSSWLARWVRGRGARGRRPRAWRTTSSSPSRRS